ncbi:hypothetical protein a10_08580 [Streptomyces acidiscabies]|nr:hypothetical protein a10_08580 [Streptomyces acidiscabies]GAV45536.1 hypothetical protein Saa2_08527 [Streptomyces acidiscabies]
MVRRDLYAGIGVGVALPHHTQIVQHQDRLSVLDHELSPLGRVFGVHGKICGTGLQDADDRDDEVRRAGQGDGDEVLGADAPFEEPVGQTVGAGVEFAVRQSVRARDDGHRVGVLPCLCLEDGHDVAGRGHVTGHRYGEQRGAFRGRQDVDLAQADSGVGGDRAQDPCPALGDAADGVGVEEVGAVLDGSGEGAVGVFGEVEGEVALRGAGGDQVGGGVQAGEVERAEGGVLEGQHGLEEGVVGEGAGGVELLDEVLEGKVLVGVGGQRRLPYAAQEFGEGGVAGQVGAQDEGVDEEADHVVGCLVGAACDGGADGDVVSGAELGEEGGQGCLEDHEEGRSVAAGQLAEFVVQFGGDGQRELFAPVRRGGGAGAVEGELELFGDSGQLAGPVGELVRGEAVRVGRLAQQLALPEGVVGVLDREFGPVGGPAFAAGGVGAGDVLGEGADGPAVADDVVQDQEEGVVGGRRLEQLGSEREFGGEVEGAAGGREHAGRQVGRVDGRLRQPDLGVVEDPLAGDAAFVGEDGPQAFVPGDDVNQGLRQSRSVEVAGQGEGEGDVVGRAGALHPLEEPEAALGGGEGDRVGALVRGEGGAGAVLAGVDRAGEAGRGGGVEEVG